MDGGLFLQMGPKTRAEIQQAYRHRKMQQEGETIKRPKKTRAEIQRDYRERKKQVDTERYEEKERERK